MAYRMALAPEAVRQDNNAQSGTIEGGSVNVFFFYIFLWLSLHDDSEKKQRIPFLRTLGCGSLPTRQ